MGRLPWWRIALLLVAALALVWWLKHRTAREPYGSEVRVATVAVAPVEGQADTYRLDFGAGGWEALWVGDGSGEGAREGLEEALRSLRAATKAFRLEKPGFEKAVIHVAPEHRGVVPFGLTAEIVQALFAAGFDNVEFSSPAKGG